MTAETNQSNRDHRGIGTAPPSGFRPLHPDEEVLTGEVSLVNASGLQLAQRPGAWFNFGAYKSQLPSPPPAAGSRVRLVVAKGRWINHLELLGDAAGGESGESGDFGRASAFFDRELGPDPGKPESAAGAPPGASAPVPGDAVVWRQLLARTAAMEIKREHQGGPPARSEDGLHQQLLDLRAQGGELAHDSERGWRLAPGSTWPTTLSWSGEAERRLGPHKRELLALLRGLPRPEPEVEPF